MLTHGMDFVREIPPSHRRVVHLESTIFSNKSGRATHILLSINALALFRVAKYTTLKSAKWLLFSDLQVAQKCRRLEPGCKL